MYIINIRFLLLLVCLFYMQPGYSDYKDKHFDIEVASDEAGNAIIAFARQTKRSILFQVTEASSIKTNAVKGRYTLVQALAILFEGTGLIGTLTEGEAIIVSKVKNKLKKKQERRMNFKRNTKMFGSFVGMFSSLLSSGTTLANEPGSLEYDQALLVEVIVTASRREQSIKDVPLSITAIDPMKFTSAGLGSIDDVIAYTPGFSINKSNGQRGRGNITARGVGQQGTTPVVAMYLDDMPLTSNSGFADGSVVYFDGLLGGELERVELLRGPQGTLFGATAIGGAIRYITKKPALEEARGGLSIDFSDARGGGQNTTYSGNLSFPIINNRLGISIAGYSEDNGGLVDRIDSASGLILEEDADKSETYGYFGDIYYQASDKLDFRLKSLRQKGSFEGSSVVNIADLDKSPKYGALIGDKPASIQDTDQEYLGFTLNYEFDAATLTATSSRVEYNVGLVDDFTDLFGGFADLLIGRDAGTTTLVPISSPVSSEKTVQEIRLTSTETEGFEWIFGLYHAEESTSQRQLSIVQPGDITFFYSEFPSEFEESAAFGNITYYITPEFDVTAGLRLTESKLLLSRGAGGLLNGGAGSGPLPPLSPLPTAEADIQSYLFNARYRPNEDLSIYTRVATGYRPASGNIPIFDPFDGERLTQEIVDQDDLLSYEVGAKGSFSTDYGLISYDLALWYIDWENFQTRVTYMGVNSLGNAENGITAQGFEGGFVFNPGNGLTVELNMAYSDSTLNSNEPSLNGLKGQSVPRVPKWSASSRASYDFSLSGSIEGNMGAGLRYVEGSPSAFTDGDLGDSAVKVMSDSYTLMDINASFYLDSFSLDFYVTNLLNKEAFGNINATVVPGTTDQFSIDGSPITSRTIGAILSYDF